ncbi:MAG: M56 family metallopeptidase [Kofleriaceae bacterium]
MKALAETLALMAGQGTLLALLAFALTRTAKLRPAWHAAVWLVVVVKFVLPWGPGLSFSLSDLLARILHRAPVVEPISALPPALQPLPPAPHVWAGWSVLAAIWIAGVAIVIFRAARSHVRTIRAARTAQLAPMQAQRLVKELATQLRVRAPELRIGDATVGPHVIGLVHTIIVVPPALIADSIETARETTTLLRAALLHELAHVRRHDVLARFVQVAAGALLWFWPIVGIVNRRLDHAREAACDAIALEAGQLSRPTYARLLVRMAELHTAAAPSMGSPHALDARVAAVLAPTTRARISWLQRIVLAAWMVLAFGGARTASAHPHPSCNYTMQLAQLLYMSYPEADLDGDGQLSRDEACELQAQLHNSATPLVSHLDPASEAEIENWLDQPLCCNCDAPEANSSASSTCSGAN